MSKKNDSLGNADLIDCETMTDAEIEDWVITTREVLVILDDEDKNTYNKVYQDFLYDLQHLRDKGRITNIDYEEILEIL